MKINQKIRVFEETIYPALRENGLLDERDAIAIPIILQYDDSLAREVWKALSSAFRWASAKQNINNGTTTTGR